jgi:hypothetical protein
MNYVYIQRRGDLNTIIEQRKLLEDEPIEELVDLYNNQVRIGIVGVHQQALQLIAINMEFIKRLGESPIGIEDNTVISLKGFIKLEKGKIKFIN